MRDILIVFVKNLEFGKVKSRLAIEIGPRKALSVYKKLMIKTRDTISNIGVEKLVTYSDSIELNDIWDGIIFSKDIQRGQDLGERMYNAINRASRSKYRKICLIGSDNMEITEKIIYSAYKYLDDYDVVFGPSKDGGYYLIAMKTPIKEVFVDISWSTELVLKQSIAIMELMKLNYALLPELSDIDVLENINDNDKKYLLS